MVEVDNLVWCSYCRGVHFELVPVDHCLQARTLRLLELYMPVDELFTPEEVEDIFG